MRFTFGISFPNLQILLRQGLFCNPHNFSSAVPAYSIHMDIYPYTGRIEDSPQFFSFPPATPGQPAGTGCAAQHQTHPGTLINHNPHRTWHTVAAAPAEISGQFRSFFFDISRNFFIYGTGYIPYRKATLPARTPSGFPRWAEHDKTESVTMAALENYESALRQVLSWQ